MGVNSSSLLSPVSKYIGRKRSNTDTDSESNVPSCKKFCPEDTIYEQCFVKGVGHDIVVQILGREWKLHKESLIKSPYFASMFSGSWNESTKSKVEIKIPNPKITEKSIDIVLGSLYHPNVSFEQEDIFSVIAAAALFQLDELVTRCEDILLKSISSENVLLYYEIAKQYSLHKVLKGALAFLHINLVLFYPSKPKHLCSIDCDLMQHLISSPKLVTSSPVDVYRILRLWLYLKVHPQSDDDLNLSSEELATAARNYFVQNPKTQSFLYSHQGASYAHVFRSLELFPLISMRSSIVEIQEDNILPQAWLTAMYEKVVPIVAEMMHPPVHNKQPITELDNYAVDIRETNLSKHCVKWCSVLPRDEIITPLKRSTWHTWKLHSYGLVTDWKFTGSSLKVMFTPNALFEGNLLSDNDIKYVPLYCRFTIYALGSSHQQISCVSKSTTKLLEKFRHEDLFSFRREDFPTHDSVTMYILSLQVFIVHRVILYKLMAEKLCDQPRSTTETPSNFPSESGNLEPPPNQLVEDANDLEPSVEGHPDNEDSDNDSDVDVEGEYYTDSESEDSSSDSNSGDSDSDSSTSEDNDVGRELPRPPPPPYLPPPPPPPREFSDPANLSACSSSQLYAAGENCTEKLVSGGELKDDPDEDSLVRIVIPKNIHTATIY
ncbi:uncharacterized protein LOC103512476 [Diaphorina citri]|uniref:Uncharacterized protein LOC103512476 n=1 Tax=Diaphorina citri TaxID=121845 RepID=A0A1S3D6I8_DIACI|nr:uncharacterized protein LOC103512476 [Diaphorina citri]KAI5703207.1 hypothetical protein M8J75_008988 [Diaphorina citri]